MSDSTKDVTSQAYDYVESMVPRADVMVGDAPMWYGWALREAFIAGASLNQQVLPDIDYSQRRTFWRVIAGLWLSGAAMLYALYRYLFKRKGE